MCRHIDEKIRASDKDLPVIDENSMEQIPTFFDRLLDDGWQYMEPGPSTETAARSDPI